MSDFRYNIRPFVEAELRSAVLAERQGDPKAGFSCLERAHILGQRSTVEHIRVHWHMLLWSLRQQNMQECLGQIVRIVGAATKTAVGLVPEGNTGGTNISPFKKLPIPADLAFLIQKAQK